MTKAELREFYLEKRAGLSPGSHAELSKEIAGRFFNELNIERVGSLHCFISLEHRDEVETVHIFERIWKEHPKIKTLAPRVVHETAEMIALPFSEKTKLELNRWGIPEPALSEPFDPQGIDVVVVPLLCFDERGHRVGYGKGFYDRFLGKCRPGCAKAGLSFFPPVERIDDVHNGDLALDFCVTPSETYRFSPI